MNVLSRDVRKNEQLWSVTLTGARPLMFDRYAGNNQTKLAWYEKLYLRPGTRNVVLPSLNVMSFFSAHNTNSAPKRLRDKRKYKDIANAILAFTSIDEEYIDIVGPNGPIVLGEPGDNVDELSGITRRFDVARLDKGIPNPKERPVIPLPWQVKFTMRISKNKEVDETEIKNLLVEGGRAIGLGTFRGVFGKFEVSID